MLIIKIKIKSKKREQHEKIILDKIYFILFDKLYKINPINLVLVYLNYLEK